MKNSLTKIIFAAILLTSCATGPKQQDDQMVSSSLEETGSYQILNDRMSDDLDVSATNTPKTEIISGTGEFINFRTTSLKSYSQDEDGNIDLNFLDSDVRLVSDAVLREMLGREYILDPNVSGTITLQSNRSLDQTSALIAYEEALRLINAAMVDQDGVYHIIPLRDAPRRISSIRRPVPASANLPGFGVEAIALRYVTPTEMEKVLTPFAPEGAILNVDNSRNLLVISGTASELSTLQEIVNTFDVDWLRGVSFALFALENVDAKTMQAELGTIFNDETTPITGMVKFVPMSRLNSLLVISHSSEYLDKVGEWIDRFDKGGQAKGRKIYIYSISNGKAENFANTLNQLYGYGSSSLTQTSQVPPSQADVGRRNTNVNGSSDTLRIVPNIEENSLLILATPEEYSVIANALKQMDTTPRQVLIEATLAEVTLNDDLKYGVNWFFESGSNEVTFSGAGTGAIASSFPGLSYVYTGSNSKKAVLNTLSAMTDVNVISSPKLMVLNNHVGELQVGDQVPVVTRSAQGISDGSAPIVNNVEFRDTGVILHITPHINKEGSIILEVQQEVSEVAETNSSGIDSPTIQQRKISSTVAVRNGETIALGGLIRETQSYTKSGVPLIKDIPLVGLAFSSTSNVTRRTELIILITPRVINDAVEMRENMENLKGEFENLDPFPASILEIEHDALEE